MKLEIMAQASFFKEIQWKKRKISTILQVHSKIQVPEFLK